jgi:hypothetical protein
LEAKVSRLQKELDETNNQEQAKTLVDELKKKNQLVMVKDAEIDSLKNLIKELRATIDQNDNQKEMQELKKQHTFAVKEKEMKDIMVE